MHFADERPPTVKNFCREKQTSSRTQLIHALAHMSNSRAPASVTTRCPRNDKHGSEPSKTAYSYMPGQQTLHFRYVIKQYVCWPVRLQTHRGDLRSLETLHPAKQGWQTPPPLLSLHIICVATLVNNLGRGWIEEGNRQGPTLTPYQKFVMFDTAQRVPRLHRDVH